MRKPSPADLKRLIRKKGKHVLLIALSLALFTGMIMFLFVADEYRATAVLFAGGDFSPQDFEALFEINGAVDAVSAQLGADLRGEKASVSLHVPDGTHLMHITVRAGSADLCARAAQALAQEAVSIAAELSPQSSCAIVQNASVPEDPCGPGRLRNMALGFIFGLILGACVFFIRELFDFTLRDETPISHFGSPEILGQIDDFRDDIPVRRRPNTPLTRYMGKTALDDVQLLYDRLRPSGKCWMFTGTCPGDGKAELCVALAETAARSGRRVLLMDLDGEQPRLARLLRRRGKLDLLDALENGASVHSILVPTALDGLCFIDNLHAVSCETFAGRGGFSVLWESLIRQFDIIIICAADLNYTSLVEKANAVVLCAGVGEADYRHLADAVEALGAQGIGTFGVAVNHCQPQD